MKAKEYDALVLECRDNTCSTCGGIYICNALAKQGIIPPFVDFWADLSPERRHEIKNVDIN